MVQRRSSVQPVRLVWQDDPAKRTVGEQHGGLADDSVSLADVAPLLLTTTASLDQLNEWIAADHEPETIVMRQFRPNVVVDGDSVPFAEDDWRHIRIGDVSYRFAEHCDRCVVTTIDPVTLHHSKEPIRTLATPPQVGRQDLVRHPDHSAEHRHDLGRRRRGRRVASRPTTRVRVRR